MPDPDWDFFEPEFKAPPREWDASSVFAIVLSVVTFLYVGVQIVRWVW